VLLEKLRSDCLEKDTVGFLLRTAKCVNGSSNLELELKGLPFPAMFLKPVHHTDNILTVLLTSLALAADTFDGVTGSHVMLVFFSPNPAATTEKFDSVPAMLLNHVCAINTVFIAAEYISCVDAPVYLRKRAYSQMLQILLYLSKSHLADIIRPKFLDPDPDPS